MKQSDLITVILVAVIGLMVAFSLTNMLLGDPDLRSESFKMMDNMSSELVEPDGEVFNQSAINPTIEVRVGDCLDHDQNGILDKAELVACGKADHESEPEKTDNLKNNKEEKKE